MREIKFRGKDMDGSGWVYGHLVKEVCCDVWIFPHDDTYCNAGGDWYYRKSPGFCVVDPETVGQFTGLKDKNGVEIYEGDVVVSQFSEKSFGVVTWHTDGYFFIDFSFGEWQYYGNGFEPLGEIMKRKIDGKSHQFKVIGNIHDNPELIK